MRRRIQVGRVWVRVGAASGSDVAFDEAEKLWATPEVAGSQEHRHAEIRTRNPPVRGNETVS
jgi:hypothetical protein